MYADIVDADRPYVTTKILSTMLLARVLAQAQHP